MSKSDDCSLTPNQLANVRAQAQRVLQEADAVGVFPTPVADILAAAKIEESKDEVLTTGFIGLLRREAAKVGAAIKRAASKVRGIFLSSQRLIFIDQSLLLVKKQFLRLHETAHGFLPWQTPMYGLVEDSDEELDPDTAALFDREANVFASEVLFQIDAFSERAKEKDFSIWTPVKESKTFGASIYASVRQYVSKNHRDCVVVVLNKPIVTQGGFEAGLRRSVQSSSFTERFGKITWPETYGPNDQIGKIVPLKGGKSSGPREFLMRDANGDRVDCRAEAFYSGHNVFVLICTNDTLVAPRLLRAV